MLLPSSSEGRVGCKEFCKEWLLVPFKPVALLPIAGAGSLVASVHFTLAVLSIGVLLCSD